MVHNLRNQTVLRTKRLGITIFVKSNVKLFIQFTNGNLSRKFVEHDKFPFNHVKMLELIVIIVPNGKSKLGADFFTAISRTC